MAEYTDVCIWCETPIRQSQEDGAWEDYSGACGCGDGEHSPTGYGHTFQERTLTLSDGTTYQGRFQYDEDGSPVIEPARCSGCGFEWNDALITEVTPTPAGRCPNEYNHPDND